jgi:hypothetical protein
MNALAKLSDHDLIEYSALPPAVRNEAWAWHEGFLAVDAGAKKTVALRTLAAALRRPYRTARNKYYAWKDAGRDWRACINRAKVGGEKSQLSKDFVEWWLHHAGGNTRVTSDAFREFALDWKRGEEIPGLDPDLPRHRLPPGCSCANLQKYARRHELAVKSMRRGLGVARAHGPQVLTTRVGLWAGSHLAIDDVWHDHFAMWQGQLVRALQLSVLDVFSGCLTAWGCKPRNQKADGSFDNLKEKFARLVAADHFSRHGYSPRGTEILGEHGTAAMSDHAMDVLRRFSDGKITLRESGITGREQALLGLGNGQGKGNFRHKTWLESLHNLIHNQLGSLPAQTGKDIDHRPEYTHGQLAEDQNLIRAARWLATRAPEKVKLLQSRTLHYHGQFMPLLGAVLDAINRRGMDPEIWTHDLEGWAECEHIVPEFRFSADSDRWLTDADLGRMEPAAREAFLSLCAGRADLTRERKLSPHEVWQGGRAGLIKLPDVAVAEMLGDDFAREERVSECAFRFRDAELAPEPLEFEARIVTPRGFEEELPNAETFKLLLNPFNLAQVYVHDARGRFLGTARRAQRVCRTDEGAVQEQFKRTATRFADVLAPIRRAHTADLAAQTRRMKENTDLLAGELAAQGIQTPAEIKRAEKAAFRADAPARERAAEVARNVKSFGGEAADEILAAGGPAEETGEPVASEPSAADDFLNAL